MKRATAKQFWRNLDLSLISDSAAVISFYFTFSLFPAFLVLLSLLSILPIQTWSQEMLVSADYLPRPIYDLFISLPKEAGAYNLIGVASIGFLFAFWSASNGMSALVRQINLIYKIEDKRSFLKHRLLSLFLTFCLGIFAVAPLIFYSFLQIIETYLPAKFVSNIEETGIIDLSRYPVYVILLFIAFGIIYYLAPATKQKLRFVSIGSIFSTLSLLVVTFAFDFYIHAFANFNKIYGSVGIIIILMMWLYVLGFVVILGAELNHSYQDVYQDKKR